MRLDTTVLFLLIAGFIQAGDRIGHQFQIKIMVLVVEGVEGSGLRGGGVHSPRYQDARPARRSSQSRRRPTCEAEFGLLSAKGLNKYISFCLHFNHYISTKDIQS